MKTKKNLVLVGMMGSGKSTIGNIISKKLDFEFIDTDFEIEKYEEISIKKIFDIKGENYFRKLEETVILKSINLDKKKKNKYVIIDSNKPILINKKIITEEIDKFIK